MGARDIKHARLAELDGATLPRPPRSPLDCTLPPEIRELGGTAAVFDPIAREIVTEMLPTAFRRWLRETLPVRGSGDEGRLTTEVMDAVLRGGPVSPQPHRLIVGPTLPVDQIPHLAGDPRGALKRFEPWISSQGGTVVFFSSAERYPVHHHRLWNYTLGWPPHVKLFCDLAESRQRENRPSYDEPGRRFDLAWDYSGRVFRDDRGAEHTAHLLTARPRGTGEGSIPDLAAIRRSGEFLAKCSRAQALGAAEVVVHVIDELLEYRCGMRATMTPIRELTARFDIDRSIIYAALRECLPERFLIELREAT